MPVKKKQPRVIKIEPFRSIKLLNMVGKGSDAHIVCSVSEKVAGGSVLYPTK